LEYGVSKTNFYRGVFIDFNSVPDFYCFKIF
jgi:hypothetical protein